MTPSVARYGVRQMIEACDESSKRFRLCNALEEGHELAPIIEILIGSNKMAFSLIEHLLERIEALEAGR